MISVSRGNYESELSVDDRIDSICDDFETACKSGATPSIEDYLLRAQLKDSGTLFRELLLLDIEYRGKRGESPTAEELLKRFPQFDAVIRDVLATGYPSTVKWDENSSIAAIQSIPTLVGRKYEVEKIVGRGTFGTVYRARDAELDRLVALKVLHPTLVGDQDYLDRFNREAQTAARLSHPGIVGIYDFAYAETGPFLVYEFVEGVTLAKDLAMRGSPGHHQAARIVAELADALDYAHRRGVVHRDLKPANIMVTPRAAASGKTSPPGDMLVRILDFGLAKREGAGESLTFEGQLLGTRAYMSPEQARGKGHLADARSDIFTLGVILFELVSGQRPFVESSQEVVAKIANSDAPDVRSRNKQVPADLAAICGKCLEREPSRRYQSASDLAEDLRRWLDGKPTVARPLSASTQLWRWCRRHRGRVLSSCLALVLSFGLTLAYWQVRSFREERMHAVIRNLLVATPTQVRGALADARDHLPAIEQELRELNEDQSRTDRERSLIALALLPNEPTRALKLVPWLLRAEPDEFDVLCFELTALRESVLPLLWSSIRELNTTDAGCVRAACALAQLDSGNARWPGIAQQVCWYLAGLPASEIRTWAVRLSPVKDVLFEPLKQMAGDNGTLHRNGAAHAIAELYSDRVDALCELLVNATDDQFPILTEVLQSHNDQAGEWFDERLHRLSAMQGSGREAESMVVQRSMVVLGLMGTGHADRAWQHWDHAADPRLQSYLIHRYAAVKLPPSLLAKRLLESLPNESGVPYAVILALGGYSPSDLQDADRAALEQSLSRSYIEHPDSGVHSAIRWLLTHWGKKEVLRNHDSSLIAQQRRRPHRWYMNKMGQAMVVVEKGTAFVRGNGGPGQTAVVIRADRTYSIAAEETTWRQYSQLMDFPRPPTGMLADCPVTRVSWFDAVEYCRRLSLMDGLGNEADAVEVTNQAPEKARVDFSQIGYRLPTDHEWECAARSGTATPRFWGELETPFLANYTWHVSDSDRTLPVGSLCPNGFGLFDCYGNASEWTASLFRRTSTTDLTTNVLDISAAATMNHRGGDWSTIVSDYRSTTSSPYVAGRQKPPSDKKAPRQFTFIGFRVARTLPD